MTSAKCGYFSGTIETPLSLFYEDFEDVGDMDLFNSPLQVSGKVHHTSQSVILCPGASTSILFQQENYGPK